MNLPVQQIPHENNPFYPLPADFWDLTEGGQKEARRAAVSQWRLDLPRGLKAAAMVASLRFFDHYYLKDDPVDEFYPMFYTKGFVPSPQFHWDIVSGWAEEQASLSVCPRGSAKSTLVRKSSIMELVTAPGWEIFYATNNHDNAKRSGHTVREQVYNNSRIHDDWAELYGGRLKPQRGDHPTGVEYFFLENNASFRVMSAQSGLRGGRPNVFILDDPENDEKAATSMDLIRQYMERLLFGIISPMVMQPGCSIRWLATFVSKRHYAFSAMDTVETAEGVRARDPRFNYWYRMLVRAGYEREGGPPISCWPEMWPSTIKQKLEDPSLAKRTSLEEIEARIGRARYLTEYLGRPGESDSSYFCRIEEKHGYTLKDVDEEFQSNPRNSKTKVCYHHQGKLYEQPLSELLSTARLVMPLDTSYTAKSTSDFKACGVFALTPTNIMFVLDLWVKRCHQNSLVNAAFQMADRWKCPVLYPEVVKESYSLYLDLKHIIETRASDVMNMKFLPRVVPLKPPSSLDKTSKISGLTFRFEHGLIKLPFALASEVPWYYLFEQVDGFNPDAESGGLQNDDAIDICAMAQMCYGGKPGERWREQVAPTDPLSLMQRGEIHTAEGLPIIHGLDLQSLTVQQVMELTHHAQAGDTPHGTRV